MLHETVTTFTTEAITNNEIRLGAEMSLLETYPPVVIRIDSSLRFYSIRHDKLLKQHRIKIEGYSTCTLPVAPCPCLSYQQIKFSPTPKQLIIPPNVVPKILIYKVGRVSSTSAVGVTILTIIKDFSTPKKSPGILYGIFR